MAEIKTIDSPPNFQSLPTLSKLVLHYKKGDAWGFPPRSHGKLSLLEEAMRYAGLSTSRIRESLGWMGISFQYLQGFLQIAAIEFLSSRRWAMNLLKAFRLKPKQISAETYLECPCPECSLKRATASIAAEP